ncbi:MAG: hypothetical protein HOW73_09830 [Polyangiaceae bacterium]|nr:hypothetical protein [Polyangiaceae bacterium]
MYARPVRKLEIWQPCDFDAALAQPAATPGAVHCRGCGHDVYDLSRMTRAEATAFLDNRQPDHCVFFEHDAEGQIVFADGTAGVIGRLARDARPMIAVATMLLAACGSNDRGRGGEATARAETAEPGSAESASAAATASEAARTETSAVPSASAQASAAASESADREACEMGANPIAVPVPPSAQRSVQPVQGGHHPVRKLAGKPMPPPKP